MTTHRYLGDRWTRADLRGLACSPVRRPDGKCIRGRNGNMLVEGEDGRRFVVVGRRLRRGVKTLTRGTLAVSAAERVKGVSENL